MCRQDQKKHLYHGNAKWQCLSRLLGIDDLSQVSDSEKIGQLMVFNWVLNISNL